MIEKKELKIASISWLSSFKGDGIIKAYYEPETLPELQSLCSDFYFRGVSFDIIGHTSNTLFSPDYKCERMISTRKLNHFVFKENSIECECGTSVHTLSLAAIQAGIEGFEGLVDLPGTVAAALYGNAGCFNCSISALLREATIINKDGIIQRVPPEWFAFSLRSSALKRNEKKAIILSVSLKKKMGDAAALKSIAEHNHKVRKETQPEPKNSLGSIFSVEGKKTFINYIISTITYAYGICLRLLGHSKQVIKQKRKHLTFIILNAQDVEPYVRNWNWYQWKDERSYTLFWKYVDLHKLMFTNSQFEIEIKNNDSIQA